MYDSRSCIREILLGGYFPESNELRIVYLIYPPLHNNMSISREVAQETKEAETPKSVALKFVNGQEFVIGYRFGYTFRRCY